MSKHTPGPWRMGNPQGFNLDTVQTEDGEHVIASVYGILLHTRVDDAKDKRWAVGIANGRIIAAAPNLYEGCRKALTCASIDSNVRRLIEDALAKVHGT